MNRLLLFFAFSLIWICLYGQEVQERSLHYYIEAAKENSPLIKDYRNQLAMQQAELQRLKAMYIHSRLELNGDYLFVPVISKASGQTTFEWNAQDGTDYYGYDLGESSGHLHAGIAWTQPLLGGASYRVARQQAEIDEEITRNRIRMEEHGLERSVTEQYLLCLLDKIQIGFADSVAALLDRQIGVVRKLVSNGMSKQSDLRLLQIERQSNAEVRTAYSHSYHTHLMDLNLLCGIDDDHDVVLADMFLNNALPQPAGDRSHFAEQFRLDSLSAATSLCTFNLQYKPRLDLLVNGGLQIGSVQEGEQMQRILLRFTNFNDNSPELLKQQPIFLPDGSTRPLDFFCEIRVIPGEIEQRREDLKSDITLTARLENRDLGSAVAELQQALENKLALPVGYNISYGGAYSEQQQSFRELTMILLLAVLLVFAVLMFLFREWLISLAILFVSVMGICGCLLALWLTGIPLNVSSYTGIIMVVGIITENASHELQTPLAVFHSKLDILLQQPDLIQEQAAIIQDLDRISGRMSHLNRDLLLLAKMGNGQFGKTDTDVASVLNELRPYFDNLAGGLLLHIDIQTDSPVVKANRSLLESMMNNLIVNAIRHNKPNGTITITLSSGSLMFANTSDETALDEHLIFNRFYRPTEKSEGNGLGLAIVKAICQYHGWNIAYAYHDGQHTFTVTFSPAFQG